MRIGQLDQRVTHQTYSTSQTGYGDKTRAWGSGDALWANVVFKGGSEKFLGDQQKTRTLVIFTIRYNTTPTNKDRILYDSKYYLVTEITHIGRQKWTQLFTENIE